MNMKKPRHKLTDKDLVNKTANCSICGPTVLMISKTKNPICRNKVREHRKKAFEVLKANKDKYRLFLGKIKSRITKHREYVKPICQKCGFIAVHTCQIDVHHIDRNHKNNSCVNLISLCANCHRLEHLGEKFNWTPEG